MNKIVASLIFLSTFLAGCIPAPYIPLHHQHSEEELSPIQLGSTTRAEIIEKLGEASILDQEGYYLTTLESRSPGFIFFILHESNPLLLAEPFLLTGAVFLRVLIEFDKMNVARRIEVTGMTVPHMQGERFLRGLNTEIREMESNHLNSSSNNEIPKLKLRTTLNKGERGSKVLFSPDGNWLVGLKKHQTSCGVEISRASVWNVGKEIRDGQTNPEYIIDQTGFIGISPDNDHFAIWKDNALQIGRLKYFHHNIPIAVIPLPKSLNTRYPACPFNHAAFGQGAELDFSSDGEKFALVRKNIKPLKTYDHYVEIRQTGGELLTTLASEGDGTAYLVSDVKFLPGDSSMAAVLGCHKQWFGAVDCHVKLWDTISGKEINTMPISRNGRMFSSQYGLKLPTVDMAISPDGTMLATRGFDSKREGDILKLWSLPGGELIAERFLPNEQSNARHLLFSSDGKLITMMSPGFILVFNYLQNPEDRSAGTTTRKVKQRALSKIDRVIELPFSCVPISDTRAPGFKELRPFKLFLTAEGKLGVKCAKAGVVIFDLNSFEMIRNFSLFDKIPGDAVIKTKIPGVPTIQQINDIGISPDMRMLVISTQEGFFLLVIPDDVKPHEVTKPMNIPFNQDLDTK